MLGIGSYTFTWATGIPGHLPAKRLTPAGLVAEAQRLGVKVVQICDNMPFADLPPAEIDSFARAAEDAGIAVELGTRGIARDRLLHHLELVRRFGGTFLRFVVDDGDDEPSADEAVARLGPVLEAFADAGVRLAIENHDRFKAREVAAMVEALGTDRSAVTLDTVNSFGAGEGPREAVPVLAPHAACLHVKDFTVRRPGHGLGFLVEGCAAGDGQLDVPWVIDAVRAASPYPFNTVLETLVSPAGGLVETVARERAWADRGVAYLRTLIPD